MKSNILVTKFSGEVVPFEEGKLYHSLKQVGEKENDIQNNHAESQEKREVIPKSKVFIVHGRDNGAKQEVSRFIESLNLEAIILHEQASSGMTIIEKIEHYSSESEFALVLYTPCDQGRGFHESKHPPQNRARQNVVFEHGYLMSKLGRQNVCALVKGDIETPNDISGVIYINLDSPGAIIPFLIKKTKTYAFKIEKGFYYDVGTKEILEELNK